MLKQILNGTKKSERHQIYFHGRVSERDQLKHRAGFGPIGVEDLVRHHKILTVKHYLGSTFKRPSKTVTKFLKVVGCPKTGTVFR